MAYSTIDSHVRRLVPVGSESLGLFGCVTVDRHGLLLVYEGLMLTAARLPSPSNSW